MANWYTFFFSGDNWWYNFWSGFGGDLLYVGILYSLYRKFNCHIQHCPRIGLHKVKNTPYVLCRKHHPATPKGSVSLKHVHHLYKLRNK